MNVAIATIYADAEAGMVSVEYTPEFYERGLNEQAAIVTTVFDIAKDDFVGVHEEVVDEIGSDLDAALAITPSMAREAININIQRA